MRQAVDLSRIVRESAELALSGYGQAGELQQHQAHGFRATLAKPFTVDGLRTCLIGSGGNKPNAPNPPAPCVMAPGLVE